MTQILAITATGLLFGIGLALLVWAIYALSPLAALIIVAGVLAAWAVWWRRA